MNETEMDKVLAGVPQGSLVFVSYKAGRAPTDRAVREAQRAKDEGLAPRWQIGQLIDVWTTKKGHRVMRVFSDTRDTERFGSMKRGAYRTLRPSLGQLLGLEVLMLAHPSED